VGVGISGGGWKKLVRQRKAFICKHDSRQGSKVVKIHSGVKLRLVKAGTKCKKVSENKRIVEGGNNFACRFREGLLDQNNGKFGGAWTPFKSNLDEEAKPWSGEGMRRRAQKEGGKVLAKTSPLGNVRK